MLSLVMLGLGSSVATEVPLILDGGVFTVPVRIHGVITLKFIVDSGAASLGSPEGPLLLGQSLLGRLPAWSVDNRRHVLNSGGWRHSACPGCRRTTRADPRRRAAIRCQRGGLESDLCAVRVAVGMGQ